MNINEMTPEQKSVVLVKLCGWRKEWTDNNSMVLLDSEGRGIGYRLMRSGEGIPNLYAPENMALLAKVIEWACKNMETVDCLTPGIWFECFFLPSEFHESMKEFADEILKSAVEAGMVNDEN